VYFSQIFNIRNKKNSIFFNPMVSRGRSLTSLEFSHEISKVWSRNYSTKESNLGSHEIRHLMKLLNHLSPIIWLKNSNF
jgi:hypothetical protein